MTKSRLMNYEGRECERHLRCANSQINLAKWNAEVAAQFQPLQVLQVSWSVGFEVAMVSWAICGAE